MNLKELNALIKKHKNTQNKKNEFLSIEGKDFSGLIFFELDLSKIEFINCNFIDSNFIKVNFSNSSILKSSFTNARITNCFFDYSEIKETTFKNVTIKYSSFYCSNLNNISFFKGTLYKTKMNASFISNAFFSTGKLENMLFNYSTLIEIDFIRTRLKSVSFYNAIINKANFINAKLEGVRTDAKELKNTRFSESERFRLKGYHTKEKMIGYKKSKDNTIIKIEIPSKATLFSSNGRKFITDKWKVLKIYGAISAKDYAFDITYKEHKTYSLKKFGYKNDDLINFYFYSNLYDAIKDNFYEKNKPLQAYKKIIKDESLHIFFSEEPRKKDCDYYTESEFDSDGTI